LELAADEKSAAFLLADVEDEGLWREALKKVELALDRTAGGGCPYIRARARQMRGLLHSFSCRDSLTWNARVAGNIIPRTVRRLFVRKMAAYFMLATIWRA